MLRISLYIMKKTLTSVVFILAFAGYAIAQHLGSAPTTLAATLPATAASSQPSSARSARSAPPPQVATATKKTGLYTDGTYTGSVADAYYGNVQVQVTIAGGKLTDVQFLQHPGGRSTSVYINSQAMPMLTQEAIQAQSANVSGVSGASETSMAFVQSLASALAQAKA